MTLQDLIIKKESMGDSEQNREMLRSVMEFDLYADANDFLKKEVVRKGYKLSKTRLENLARAFRFSYQVFGRLLNRYLIKLEREANDTKPPRSDEAEYEREILKKVQAKCGTAILDNIKMEFKEPESRAERRQLAKEKKEYIGMLARAWFTHFVSACLGCAPDEHGDIPFKT